MNYTADHKLIDQFLNFISHGGMKEIVDAAKRFTEHEEKHFREGNKILLDFISANDDYEYRLRTLENRVDKIIDDMTYSLGK